MFARLPLSSAWCPLHDCLSSACSTPAAVALYSAALAAAQVSA